MASGFPTKKPIQIAHSPDADDRFMFWPLREGLVSHPDFAFTFAEADTQTLNQWSEGGTFDVIAISAVQYLNVADHYQPLRMGCSVGDNYGPVLVSLRPYGSPAEALRQGALLLTPGLGTTAHRALGILGYEFKNIEVVPIAPLERVFERLQHCQEEGRDAVALLIHEGRLLFESRGCLKILDLGEAWKAKTGASLPLGMNVISRRLPECERSAIAELLVASCTYAQAHESEFLHESRRPNSPYATPLSERDLKSYLRLYANETTRSVSREDAQSFVYLLESAAGRELGGKIPVDWI